MDKQIGYVRLANVIEDIISYKVDIDEYEDVMPKVIEILYQRYCLTSQTKHIYHKQTTHN